jgi:hypothetical protein
MHKAVVVVMEEWPGNVIIVPQSVLYDMKKTEDMLAARLSLQGKHAIRWKLAQERHRPQLRPWISSDYPAGFN